MLNVKHLYYFHIFAQERSTTKAAKRLGISSPALTNQLKQLAEYLGVPLSRRVDGKVSLTETGEIVLHYANRMYAAYDELKCRLTVSNEAKTSFRAGICQYIGARFSFDLLSLIVDSGFSLSQNVHINSDSAGGLIEGIKNGQYDFILGTFNPEPTGEKSWLSQSLAFPVRIFAPLDMMAGFEEDNKNSKLTDLTKIIELANSKKISLVLTAQSSVLRDETERFLLNSEILPARTIECNTSGAIVQLVERGFAMGFLPTPCLLDFKSAESLAVLGPPAGYWLHSVSAIIKDGGGRSMLKISPMAEIFSPGTKFK